MSFSGGVFSLGLPPGSCCFVEVEGDPLHNCAVRKSAYISSEKIFQSVENIQKETLQIKGDAWLFVEISTFSKTDLKLHCGQAKVSAVASDI